MKRSDYDFLSDQAHIRHQATENRPTYWEFRCRLCGEQSMPYETLSEIEAYGQAHTQNCPCPPKQTLFGSSRFDQAITAANLHSPGFNPRYLIGDRIEMSNLDFVTLVEKLVEALAVGSAVDRRNELESLVVLYREQLKKCALMLGRAPASLEGNVALFIETQALLDLTVKQKERPKSEYVAATLNDAISPSDFKVMIEYIRTVVGRSFHYYSNESNTTIELNEATLFALVAHAKLQDANLESVRADLKRVHELVEHSLGPILEAL